ncbi:MAG: hypothetical protein IJ793_03105 [Opitutales bacterium]|nr:hypothetical protein [Opitutales bacterium]
MNTYKNEIFEVANRPGEKFDRESCFSESASRLMKAHAFFDTLNLMNTPEFRTPPPRKRRSSQHPSNVGNALCANAFVPATVHNRFFSVLS